MKKVNIFIGLFVIVSVSALMMVNGCGSAASSGGGGGASAVAVMYWGCNTTNKIYYISGSSTDISGTIELGCYSPFNIAASPDGKKLYV